MRVILTDEFNNGHKTHMEDLAINSLDGSDYERGELETIIATVENNSRAIGNLLGIMTEKEMINLDDVKKILGLVDDTTITKC